MNTETLEKLVADLGGKQGVAAVTLYMMGVAQGNLEAMARQKVALERSVIFNAHFFQNKQLGELNLMIDDYSAHYELFKRDLKALDPQILETICKFNQKADEIPSGPLQ